MSDLPNFDKILFKKTNNLAEREIKQRERYMSKTQQKLVNFKDVRTQMMLINNK